MEWFIVAIVFVWGEQEPRWSQMSTPFKTYESCQNFYQTNRHVANDVSIMYPNARRHTLVCLSSEDIAKMKGTSI